MGPPFAADAGVTSVWFAPAFAGTTLHCRSGVIPCTWALAGPVGANPRTAASGITNRPFCMSPLSGDNGTTRREACRIACVGRIPCAGANHSSTEADCSPTTSTSTAEPRLRHSPTLARPVSLKAGTPGRSQRLTVQATSPQAPASASTSTPTHPPRSQPPLSLAPTLSSCAGRHPATAARGYGATASWSTGNGIAAGASLQQHTAQSSTSHRADTASGWSPTTGPATRGEQPFSACSCLSVDSPRVEPTVVSVDRGHPILLISGAPTATLELALEHSRRWDSSRVTLGVGSRAHCSVPVHTATG